MDKPEGSLQRAFVYEGGRIHDFVQRVEIRSTMSHRPLHDLMLAQEQVFVGSMLYALRRHRATILELKTDSVLYRLAKRQRMCLPELAYSDLHSLRARFELVDQAQGQLDSHFSLPPNAERRARVQSGGRDG